MTYWWRIIGSPPKTQAHLAHNGTNNGVAVRGMPYDDRGRGNKDSREPCVRVRFDRNPEIIKVPKCLNEAKIKYRPRNSGKNGITALAGQVYTKSYAGTRK